MITNQYYSLSMLRARSCEIASEEDVGNRSCRTDRCSTCLQVRSSFKLDMILLTDSLNVPMMSVSCKIYPWLDVSVVIRV